MATHLNYERQLDGSYISSTIRLDGKTLLQLTGRGRYYVERSLDGAAWAAGLPVDIVAACRCVLLDELRGVYIRVRAIGTPTAMSYLSDGGYIEAPAAAAAIAPAYTEGETYNAGDIAERDGGVYVCTEDGTTGAWNGAAWTATTIAALIGTLQGYVETLQETSGGLNAAIEGLNTSVSTINADIDDVEADVAELQGYVETLQETSGGLNAAIEGLNTSVLTINADIDEVEADVVELQGDVEALQGGIDNLDEGAFDSAKTLQIKRSSLSGAEPAALLPGEMAYNTADKNLFIGGGGTIVKFTPNYTNVLYAENFGGAHLLEKIQAAVDYVKRVYELTGTATGAVIDCTSFTGTVECGSMESPVQGVTVDIPCVIRFGIIDLRMYNAPCANMFTVFENGVRIEGFNRTSNLYGTASSTNLRMMCGYAPVLLDWFAPQNGKKVKNVSIDYPLNIDLLRNADMHDAALGDAETDYYQITDNSASFFVPAEIRAFDRLPGMVLRFEVSDGVYAGYRYTGTDTGASSWNNVANWEAVAADYVAYHTLASAIAAVKTELRYDDYIITYEDAADTVNAYEYDAALGAWTEEAAWAPITKTYYTKATAVAAAATYYSTQPANRKKGACIMFETAYDTYSIYRYTGPANMIGDYDNAADWADADNWAACGYDEYENGRAGLHIYAKGRWDAETNTFVVGPGVLNLNNMTLTGIQSGKDRQACNRLYPLDGIGGVWIEKPFSGTTQSGNNVNAILLENVLVQDSKHHGIYMETPILSTIRGCRVSRAGGHGIFINGGTTLVLDSVYVPSANYAGFCIQGVVYCTLLNTVAEYCGMAYLMRSNFAVTMFSPACEQLGFIANDPWSKSRPVTGYYGTACHAINKHGRDYVVMDVTEGFYDEFLGVFLYVSGGNGLTVYTPFATNAGRFAADSSTAAKRRFSFIKIVGNCRECTIVNPVFNRNAAHNNDVYLHDIYIDAESTNFDLTWNPARSIMTGDNAEAIARGITDDYNVRAPVYAGSDTALIRSGNRFYTDIKARGVRINGNDSTDLLAANGTLVPRSSLPSMESVNVDSLTVTPGAASYYFTYGAGATAQSIGFSSTPGNGYSCDLYIVNNTGVAITQPFPSGFFWLVPANGYEIPAGDLLKLNITRMNGRYILQVVGVSHTFALPTSGVYIVTEDFEFVTPAEWSRPNADARAVALCKAGETVLIALSEAGTYPYGGTGYIEGVSTAANLTAAKADYDHGANTALIIAAVGTPETGGEYAAWVCAGYDGGLDDIGWKLPSFGYLYDMYVNIAEINAALAVLGTAAVPLSTTSLDYYISSTQNADRIRVAGLYTDGDSNDMAVANRVRDAAYRVRPIAIIT